MKNNFMRSFVLILFMILAAPFLYGQITVSEDSAISIAIKNGLKEGLEKPHAQLINDSVWMVSCLLCDDESVNSQVIKISATNGEFIEKRGHVIVYSYDGEQIEKSVVTYPFDWDSVPKKNFENEPQRLTNLNEGNESNPVISPDNRKVAFKYGNKSIGVIGTDRQNFEKLCDGCSLPRWLDSEWISYRKDSGEICKRNIKTGENIQITRILAPFHDYQISPDNKWIAYTSHEVWDTPGDSSGLPLNIHIFMYGEGQELCLLSTDGKTKKFITKIGKYVHTPCWSDNGDSLFFSIGNIPHFATGFEDEAIVYSRYERRSELSSSDYIKVIDGVFPYKNNCLIYEVGVDNMEPKYLLVSKPGRYDNLSFSNGLGYLVYTNKECKFCEQKLWILQLR